MNRRRARPPERRAAFAQQTLSIRVERFDRSAVMFGVLLGSVMMMIGSVQRVAVCDFRVMRGLFVVPGFVMLGRFAMMLCRFVVVMRGFLMMFVDIVIHDPLLGY
jgi:hypothetical protein